MISDKLKDEIIDFVRVNRQSWEDKLLPYDIVCKKYGEDAVYELFERGYLYEPVLGWVKEV